MEEIIFYTPKEKDHIIYIPWVYEDGTVDDKLKIPFIFLHKVNSNYKVQCKDWKCPICEEIESNKSILKRIRHLIIRKYQRFTYWLFNTKEI